MNWLRYNYDCVSALSLALKAKASEHGTPSTLANLQRKRFARLLGYARERSPFYRRLYQEHADVAVEDLARLPTVTKALMMEHFSDVVTDRSLDMASVLKFAEARSNLGRALRHKYFVARTSGTTGFVGHYVHDLFSYSLIHVLTGVRSKGISGSSFFKEWRRSPRRLRIASLLSPVANFGVASVMASAPTWVRAAVEFRLLNIFEPWTATIDALNAFQPDVIGSFPTILEQLAESQAEGALRIHPQTVRSGGETLTVRARTEISQAFHCPVYDCYGCAESGWIGMECEQQDGMHVFADWVIVEPVDYNRNPVPPMVESDMVLITNLANYAQPFIRFEIPDRVTALDGDCPCGNRLPRVRLKGRTAEVLHLAGAEGAMVVVPPFHLTTLAEMVPGVGRYQIILEDTHHLSVSFTARQGFRPGDVAAALRSSFQRYLGDRDLLSYVEVVVAETDAIQKDVSGKTRQIFSRQRDHDE